MSPIWILLALRVIEVVVTTGAIKRAKLQSKCHHQQTNAHFFTDQMPFQSPNQQCQNTEWKSTEGKKLSQDRYIITIPYVITQDLQNFCLLFLVCFPLISGVLFLYKFWPNHPDIIYI